MEYRDFILIFPDGDVLLFYSGKSGGDQAFGGMDGQLDRARFVGRGAWRSVEGRIGGHRRVNGPLGTDSPDHLRPEGLRIAVEDQIGAGLRAPPRPRGDFGL